MAFSAKICGIIAFLAIEFSYASWSSSNSKQYHIQTDEGPERFFRYLTDNGQYRKEKRLQDGTVIGTDAWIDASGFLRQKDYIADGEGYRILKSKTIYVGKDQPIEDALRSVRKGSTMQSSDNPAKNYQTSTLAGLSTPSVANYIPTSTPSWLYYNHPSTPFVIVDPKTQQTKNSYTYPAQPTSTPVKRPVTATLFYEKDNVPSLKLLPPFSNVQSTLPTSHLGRGQFGTINGVYSTQSTVAAANAGEIYSTHLSALNNELLPPIDKASLSENNVDDFPLHISTTPTPVEIETSEKNTYPLRNNDLEPEPLFSRSTNDRVFAQRNSYLHTSGNYNENIGSGYEPQFPQYDGTAINDNGFRYYLPRQYHEEVGSNSQIKAGSFGYIDPFGIRRVIYYNASPEQGFVHKKNNRYVGFSATPYDPRPI